MTPTIAGLIAAGVPLLLVGLAFLRGRRAVFGFYLVACIVGLGYLFTTGAIDDIGAKVLELIGQATAEKGAEPAAAPAN